MMDFEGFKKAMAEYERKWFQELSKAKEKCLNGEERDNCMNAYHGLHKAMDDRIRQQFGLPPRIWEFA